MYKGQYKNDYEHGYGELIFYTSGEVYKGEFKEGVAYNADISRNIKKQTILVVSTIDDNIINSVNSLRLRYEKVIHVNKTSSVNFDLLIELITHPTKGDKDKKKIKIAIDDHCNKLGVLDNQDFALKTLHKTLEEIRKYNSEYIDKPIDRVDIVLNYVLC